MKQNKFLLAVGAAALSFSVLNMLDLFFTLLYFQAEINPLVLANPSRFYVIKFISSFIAATYGIYILKKYP